MNSKNYLKVGQIVTTHGVKGEIKLYPYTDDLESLSKNKCFYLDEELKNKIEVTKCSVFKNVLLLRIENIHSIEEASSFINKYVYLPKKKITKEDTYYIDDLLNMDVYSLNEKETYDLFGKVTDVFNTGASDVYEVEGLEGNKIYLPAIKSVILNVDLKENKMYVKIMEGLI